MLRKSRVHRARMSRTQKLEQEILLLPSVSAEEWRENKKKSVIIIACKLTQPPLTGPVTARQATTDEASLTFQDRPR